MMMFFRPTHIYVRRPRRAQRLGRAQPLRRGLTTLALLGLLSSLSIAAIGESSPGSHDPSRGPQSVSGPTALASSQLSPALAKVLADIRAKDKDQLSVAEEDGRFLRMLVASTQRKRALEIGSAYGYSAIWIGLGLRDSGGKLVTIEIDPARAKDAIENVKKAALADVVTVVSGDAFKEIPKLGGTFDCVFVDAWKRDYIKFFDMTYPRMDKGGIFLGHNVINKKSEMTDFLTRINTSPDLFTAIMAAPSGEGVSISYKRR